MALARGSVAGASLRVRGGVYFNPDEAAVQIIEAEPGISSVEANSRAWLEGKRLLENAILRRAEFAFETTLGGNTIPALLQHAHDAGLDVRVWYVGLDSAEHHVARVRARVARGGHDIPAGKIRERYDRCRENLIRLFPVLTELWLFDNSEEGDPAQGIAPRPLLILHAVDGRIVDTCDPAAVPGWAKPIFVVALRQFTA